MKTTKRKTIKLPKCPYCKSTEFSYETEYIDNEYCEVTATCSDCGKEFGLTFECTIITKMEE